MSRQRKKRRPVSVVNKRVVDEQTDARVESSAVFTANFTQNNLVIPDYDAAVLQMAKLLPETMQKTAMEMAANEQIFRHSYAERELENAKIVQLRQIDTRHDLEMRCMRNIFITDMLGKVFGFLVLAVLIALVCFGRYEEAAIILGATVFLAALVKLFVKNSTAEVAGGKK